ncbi:hypothetical protein Dda_8873 [Drechslerella dactyloides]|uniref:Uncharacterized protein n=1 Tax=Drechslerella dactyloides TaxID=74499 RepID=A0AAD6NH36_DREDA|nr:hypothetical protein Dda_8873 [Drechslerella dactyloides]
MGTIAIQQFGILDVEAATPHKPVDISAYEFSTDRSSCSTPPFPFLTLPPEIRDEIYSYLVCFNEPAIHNAALPPNQPDYQPIPRLDLSIFRVSKQIHEESSRVFYSQNVFPVRMLTESRLVGGKTYFDVWYDTPWESMIYSAAEDAIGTYSGTIWSAGSYINESDLPISPSPRYRPLLRHIRVDVVDVRIDATRRKIEPLSALARAKVGKLLLPLSYRLQDMLSEAGTAARLDINVFSALADGGCENCHANKREPYLVPVNTTRHDLTPRIDTTDTASEPAPTDLYEELLSTIAPLTAGPYRHTLRLSRPLAAQFGDATPAILHTCAETAAAELTDNEKDLFKKMRISTACFWVMLKGRVHAVDAHEDDCTLDAFSFF